MTNPTTGRALVAVFVGLGAAAILSACAVKTNGVAATRNTPSPVKTVTVTPKAAATPKPKPRPRPKGKTVTRTVVAAQPAPPQPAPQADPWAVVSEYCGDVTSRDYWDAWNLLGPSFQANMGSYDSFVAGY